MVAILHGKTDMSSSVSVLEEKFWVKYYILGIRFVV